MAKEVAGAEMEEMVVMREDMVCMQYCRKVFGFRATRAANQCTSTMSCPDHIGSALEA